MQERRVVPEHQEEPSLDTINLDWLPFAKNNKLTGKNPGVLVHISSFESASFHRTLVLNRMFIFEAVKAGDCEQILKCISQLNHVDEVSNLLLSLNTVLF